MKSFSKASSFNLIYTHKGFTSERVGDVGVPRPISISLTFGIVIIGDTFNLGC
jgi:hypothetical protein